MTNDENRPLTGVRVLDLADGKGEMCGRYLADLGADVIRIEPPGGAPSRSQQPMYRGHSLHFATHNANKRGLTLDLGTHTDQQVFLRLVDSADILIEADQPFSVDDLLARNPRLVVVSITDFGQDGPYRDWAATEWTHLALGGVLARSGIPGEPPLMPPGSMALESASVQAAWAALVAYWRRLDTGVGDHVDCAINEITAQAIDAGYGIGGTASGGVPAAEGPRGRPDARHLYPIFPCADGHVRICLLARRQWRGMFAWLGEPAEFADPKYDAIGARFAARAALYPLIGELFADRTRDDLIAEGQRHGVPIAALLAPGEVLDSEHLTGRGALIDAEVAPGLRGRIPAGFVEINGVHAGHRHRAPEPGEHNAEILAELAAAPAPATQPVTARDDRPLAGLRVLDLGVIVVGAEVGRLLADQGADVIKVENRGFPDGSRQSLTGAVMTPSFAWGHRNKRGLGLDLRSPDGAAIFKRLAATADVILSNFKSGTLESLGLGYDELKKINPRIVMADSSALGATGPWSKRMGYGPLVRASIGLTGLWRQPGDPDGFSDASTVYPDHIAARVEAVAVLATLIARRRTGTGGTVSVAQAETVLTQLSADLLREYLVPGSLVPRGNTGEHDAPYGVYPCGGDDEWCAITVRGDDDWQRLCQAIGRPDLAADPNLATAADRVAHREKLEAALTEWTRTQPPRDVMTRLQAHGVPAGMMQRVTDYADDPQLTARRFFGTLRQPQIDVPLPTERGPAHFRNLPDPPLRPAPLIGEHTREICADLLGMTDPEIDTLIEAGVLEAGEA